VRVLGGQRFERQVYEPPIAIAKAESRELEALALEFRRDTQLREHLERVRVDHRGARGVLAADQFVDDDRRDTGSLQRGRQCEAGWSAPHDEHIGVEQALGGSLHGRLREFLRS
jgi:hypothetical protein